MLGSAAGEFTTPFISTIIVFSVLLILLLLSISIQLCLFLVSDSAAFSVRALFSPSALVV